MIMEQKETSEISFQLNTCMISSRYEQSKAMEQNRL